jgi:hypothetical protein
MPKIIKSIEDVRRLFLPKDCPKCAHPKERHKSGNCTVPITVEMPKGNSEIVPCDCNSLEGRPSAPQA